MKARSGRVRGLVGGQPSVLSASMRVACPACDAVPGTRCVVWAKAGGKREFIRGDLRRGVHKERTAAAKGAA